MALNNNNIIDVQLSEDDVFTDLADGDTAVEIIGFVEAITAPTEVGRGRQYKLFKFVLTNGTQKLTCLMWGDELINQHRENIQLNRIIHIDGGRAKTANIGYARSSENFVQFELIIQRNTTLQYHGFHNVASIALPAAPVAIDFQSLRDADGVIMVHCWIKTPFASAPSRFGNSTYGVGSVTDGSHKVPVHVSNYAPALEFEKGSPVTIQGTVKVTGGIVNITADNSQLITSNPDEEPLSMAQVIGANRLFKRRADD